MYWRASARRVESEIASKFTINPPAIWPTSFRMRNSSIGVSDEIRYQETRMNPANNSEANRTGMFSALIPARSDRPDALTKSKRSKVAEAAIATRPTPMHIRPLATRTRFRRTQLSLAAPPTGSFNGSPKRSAAMSNNQGNTTSRTSGTNPIAVNPNIRNRGQRYRRIFSWMRIRPITSMLPASATASPPSRWPSLGARG